MSRYEHMSWCDSTHDESGECELRRGENSDGSAWVFLNGTPCDHVYIGVVDGQLFDVEDVDRLVESLNELRPLYEASEGEGNCDSHHHNYDNHLNDHADDCPYMTDCPCPDGDCPRCQTVEFCEGECLP